MSGKMRLGHLISPGVAETVLAVALRNGGDFAELFLEESRFSHLVVSNGKVHEAQPGLDMGAGIRVIAGGVATYAYTTEISADGLMEVAGTVAQAVGCGSGGSIRPLRERNLSQFHPAHRPPFGVSLIEKLELANRLDGWARAESSRVTDIRVFYSDVEQSFTVANSDGRMVSDRRSRVRVYTQVVVDRNESRRLAVGPGACAGFEFFAERDLEADIRAIVGKVLRMQEAQPAAGGEFPIILGAGYGGLLFHEACGHSLEADAVARRGSVFRAEQIGTQIAAPVLTLVDDATVPGAWGSFHVDDEGTPAHRTVMIENGVLRALLVDRHNGAHLGLPANGAARRQSYRYAPTSRMSNTYVLPGSSCLDEMISSIEHGLYAERVDNGLVDTASGNFTFPVTVGHMIRDGKLAEQVTGAQVVGNAAEVLTRIDMVGSAEEVAACTAICRAASGVIPVTFGLPPVRVSRLRVRGGA